MKNEKAKFLIVVVAFLQILNANAGPVDSSRQVPAVRQAHWRVTARLHTKGMFTYGGRLGTDNPAFDVSIAYDRKNWGALLFKGVDLKDHHTFYNFSLLAIYRNFHITPKLTFTPYAGTFLEQAEAFADHGSDAAAIMITSYKLDKRFTAEHMAMFSNLIVEPGEMDWVNRFRLTYASRHMDVVSTLWYNTAVFDPASYWTAGINVAYSRVRLSEELMMSLGVTDLMLFRSSDEELNPTANHFMVTWAVQWNR